MLFYTCSGGNLQLKSDMNTEKSAQVDRGMTIVFAFLGVIAGVLILLTIILVSYCIYRRRDVRKQINNGMFIMIFHH